MTLFDWFMKNGITNPTNKTLKYVDVQVCVEMDSDKFTPEQYEIILSAGPKFKSKNITRFVILSNGYAVGYKQGNNRCSTPLIKHRDIITPAKTLAI